MYGLNNIERKGFINSLGAINMQSDAGNAFDLQQIDINKIKTDKKNFQNRAADYSEKSVNAIVNAVKNGSFNWFSFAPVTLWESPNGDLFILSGHSRTEAFKRLNKLNAEFDGLKFDKIPAKIFKGSFEDAKKIALNSNALSTPETLLERAEFYKKERLKLNDKKQIKELKEKALRENSGAVIWDLSYLNDGFTKDFLKRFKNQEDSEKAFENYLRAVNIAQWVGKTFEKYKNLSSIHDTEIFNFLNKNYGNKAGQYNSFAKLDERLKVLYNRNVKNEEKKDVNGKYTTPFGLKIYEKNDDELKTIREKEKNFKDAEKQLKKIIKSLRGRTTDKTEIFNALNEPFNVYINTLTEFWASVDNEKKRDTDKRQGNLFGVDSDKLLKLITTIKARFEQLKHSKKNDFILEQVEKILTVANDLIFFSDGLGKPTIKFEFESNEQLKDFLKENKENLIDSEVEDAEVVEDEPNFKRKSLRGGFQDGKPADVFNCSESELVCKGFKPTYKRLSDYSGLIDAADGQNKFCGYGFDKTTLNTLLECCKYYPQVVRLAEHLKADSELQSAFNVWHWLHTNIAYNYDAEGKEEIRTPARVWADRKTGVDCDCLAVFTACLFICMGYKPAFEIVGFNNTNQYSHIFVNLNGAAVDRVLPVFLQRPALITKTMIMQIPVYKLSGVNGLNGCELGAVAKLQGLYSSTLSKIFTHTATPEETLDFRKIKVLLSLQGVDNNAFKLASAVMPYVAAIDDNGAYYFRDAAVAAEAARQDKILHDLELRNDAKGLAGWNPFKDIAKAAKSVGSGIAKAAKATVNSVANATKATFNLTKAGIQAATGNTQKAKETLIKAGQQAKSSVVDPLKTSWDVTVDITKNTVIDPLVNTVRIAGKLFKIIFIKLNPVLILMRNSLRLLIAVNFLGMATRLNIANYSKDAAIKAGYTAQQWEEAKKAKDRVIRFFTKIGGVKSKIEKSIENGAKKKALFKKDYNKNTKIVETSDTDAQLSGTAPILLGVDGLGEPGTIAAALASVGAFIAKVWGWIKNIVPKAVEWVKENKDKIKTGIDTAKNLLSKKGNSTDNDTATTATTTTYYTTTANTNTGAKSNSNNKTLLIAAFAVAGIGAAVALSGGKKRR